MNFERIPKSCAPWNTSGTWRAPAGTWLCKHSCCIGLLLIIICLFAFWFCILSCILYHVALQHAKRCGSWIQVPNPTLEVDHVDFLCVGLWCNDPLQKLHLKRCTLCFWAHAFVQWNLEFDACHRPQQNATLCREGGGKKNIYIYLHSEICTGIASLELVFQAPVSFKRQDSDSTIQRQGIVDYLAEHVSSCWWNTEEISLLMQDLRFLDFCPKNMSVLNMKPTTKSNYHRQLLQKPKTVVFLCNTLCHFISISPFNNGPPSCCMRGLIPTLTYPTGVICTVFTGVNLSYLQLQDGPLAACKWSYNLTLQMAL